MKSLSTLQAWEQCVNDSHDRPVFIFKHSTACPISTEAHRQVQQYIARADDADPQVYMVKVIEERPVSNQIADVLGIQHKSPQLILMKDGAALWSASPYGITVDAIKDATTHR